MSESARSPRPKIVRWVRRIGLSMVIAGTALAFCGYYACRHLTDIALALAARAAPNLRVSVEKVALISRTRVELRNLSVKLRDGNVEILRLRRAAVDFSIDGLRNRRIDALTIEHPVVLVNDAILNQLPFSGPPKLSRASSSPWMIGSCTIRSGQMRLDISHAPTAQFEFWSEPQGDLQHLQLSHIEITGRDKAATSLARIRSVEARFSLAEAAAGHLKELIVRNPSLHLAPDAVSYLPQPSAAQASAPAEPGFRVERLLIEHGDLRVSGFGAGVPDATLKFGVDTTEVRLGEGAARLHHAQLWEIALWPASSQSNQFLTVDSAQIDVTTAGLLLRKELAGVIVTGMAFRAGEDFRSLIAQTESESGSSPAPQEKGKPWMIRNLALHNGRVTIADLGVEIPNVQFDLNTQLNDVPLSSDIRYASNEIQKLEFADVTVHSPLDPFVPVLNLKTVFVSFSLAQIMRREIDSLVLLNPTIFVGPDLFWYVDALKKRQAEAAPAATSAASGEDGAGWRLKKFEAAYGQLVIASEGQARVPLPLSFSTHSENIRFNSFSDLQLKLNLLIPTADYPYPDYQLDFKQLGGEIKFGLPPEKQANNLVQTLKSEAVRWRQFTGEKLFWSVTYDEKGIYGQFGGAGYGGYLNGQFSFFIKSDSPWQGWISGSKMDLGLLTDVITPENFHMTGPADFRLTVKARSREIDQLSGTFKTRKPGRLKIGKLDELIAKIPPEWSSVKQGATRIGLETLRDFEYESGNGDFSFAGKTGKLSLRLRGPSGSRNFDIVLH